jgi:nicotinate phosphoribosyltransferase
MEDVAHALLVDLYELTMVDAYRREGMADRPSTFSLFNRKLPPGRGFLVAAGLDDCLTWLEELHFGEEELAAIDRLGIFGDDFLSWLGELRFTGDVRAVPEGSIVFPHEPVIEVDAPIAEAQLAETFLLNQATLQTTLASKAARLRHAAAGRTVVDFALRRTQGIDAGMKLVRICGLVGLQGTSNVAGADRYGIPASGTMAHAFIQAHEDETEAFRAFVRAFGDATVLLVDTYDTPTGVDRAVVVASEARAQGINVRGIRLDSGDLAALARDARTRLDAAGLTEMRIIASGSLDEHRVAALIAAGAPIDGFGVGTSLGVSDDAPSLDSVYKLVSYDGHPVLKTSTGKEIWPGLKQVWRATDWSGDVLALADETGPEDHEPLLVPVMQGGRRTPAGRYSLEEANKHFEQQWSQLPEPLRDLTDPPSYPVTISSELRASADELAALHAAHDS